MRKYAIPFFLIITTLGILAVFCYNFFEIYETSSYKYPSRQALTNEYLAMERWLNKTGHNVRVIPYADASTIFSAPEKVTLIHAFSFNWHPTDTYNKLEQWMETGGNLILCMDVEKEEAAEFGLNVFLENYGVTINYNDPAPTQNIFSGIDNAFPDFSNSVSFNIKKNSANITIEDAFGKTRLVQMAVKKGSITICGNPVFMKSYNLEREKNALLSWSLTGKKDVENKGALFVRGIKIEPSFFGKLAERGNFPPLLVSALVLIAVGFWMVIPVFGVLKEDTAEQRGKPMQERFLAEARFLKKYKGLGSYLDIYYIFLKQRFRQQYGEIIDDDSAFFSKLAEICNIKKQDIGALQKFIAAGVNPALRGKAFPADSSSANAAIKQSTSLKRTRIQAIKEKFLFSRHLTNREFIKHIYTIETIMERL